MNDQPWHDAALLSQSLSHTRLNADQGFASLLTIPRLSANSS